MNTGNTHDERKPDPFGGDYVDVRDDKSLAEDRARVQTQTEALRSSPRRDVFDRQMLRAILARRSERSDLVPIELVRGRRRALTPIVRGELLVHASVRHEDPDLWSTLGSHGLSSSEVEQLDNRVLRLSNPDRSGEELDEIARLVRSAGRACSVNHIPALAPRVKGQGGPEPTSVALSFPPSFATRHAPQQQVRVAVVDTGITDRPRSDGWLDGIGSDGWLNGTRTSGIDPLDAIPHENGFLDFAAGHGTLAAGIVAQVAPQAEVFAYRALDSDGVGSEVDIACAIVQAAADGAQIINLSLGAETLEDQPLLAVEVALDIVSERSPDALVIAAAGNTGGKRPVFPAASRRVVAVGALDPELRPADWSTRGWWVDCSTIGQGIVSTYVEGVESSELDPRPDKWGRDPWALASGTSFAAPQISAAVARICYENAGVTPRAALRQLLRSARPIPDFGSAVRILPGT